MSTNRSYFKIGSKLFWGLVLLVFVFALLNLNPGLFKGEHVAKELIMEDSLSKIDWSKEKVKTDTSSTSKDTASNKKDDYITRTWKWKSFDGKNYMFTFKISSSDFRNSQSKRNASNSFGGALYAEMFNADRSALENLVEGYKRIIRENSLDYYEGLNMVATSIQSIPYTWVLPDNVTCGSYIKEFKTTTPPYNCAISEDPPGCCDHVKPYGVYSPVEFAVNRAGDCDTRSLFAYTVFKKMGYDVAVMVSEEKHHSVLGVLVPGIPSDGKRGNIGPARNYFLWELTSYGWSLGQRIEGNDWRIDLN